MADKTHWTKNIMSPEKASEMFVGKEEFAAFRAQQAQTSEAILDAVKNLSAPKSEPSRAFSVTKTEQAEPSMTPEMAGPASNLYTLNPAHQAIFEQYFDPSDGFKATFQYPYFEITVPLALSNADDAHKKFYKEDKRLKFIKHDNIEGGIRDWCKMVALNLKYNRNVKLK